MTDSEPTEAIDALRAGLRQITAAVTRAPCWARWKSATPKICATSSC